MRVCLALPFVFILLLSSCENTPQRPIVWQDGATEFGSEQQETARAREITEYLRSNYGSASALSIGSKSPRGYDLSHIVRTFGQKSAMAYTERHPKLWVYFDIEKEEDFRKSRDEQLYRLTASLSRPNKGGLEVLMRSSESIRCFTRESLTPEKQCQNAIEIQAERLLYELKPLGTQYGS